MISVKNGLTVWARVWSAVWGCHVDEDKKQLWCGGVVKAVMSVCEQRWTMKTVRGGGWSAWMRWPHWRSSSLTWRNSKLSDMFHTESRTRSLRCQIHWDIPSDMDRGSWSILASITGQYHGFVLLPLGSLYKVLVLKWCSSMLWGCKSRGLYYKISSTYPRSHLPVCPNTEVCGARSGTYPSCYREGETWT